MYVVKVSQTDLGLLGITMKVDIIKETGINELGELYVTPENETFPYIYREALELNWCEHTRSLKAPKPRKWLYEDWFKQILKGAAEQGIKLIFDENSKFVGIDSTLRESLTFIARS